MTQPPVPEPPWHAPSKPPVSRPLLSRDAIVGAALEVLDAEGLDAISMRRVAQQLGTGVASLYAHVANKEQLLQLLLDRIYGELKLPAPDPDNWQEQVKDLARGLRAVLRRHRDIARITFGPMPVGPNFVVVLENFLAILDAAGVRGPLVSSTGDLLSLYAQAYALEEAAAYDDPCPHDIPGYLASLPADRFPHLATMAGLMRETSADERFELGLDLLVRGIEAARDRDAG